MLPFRLHRMQLMLKLIAALALLASVASGQGAPSPMQAGLRQVAAGAYDSATVQFESIIAKGGQATPRALQELVALYARAGRLDDAFRMLERARTSGADFSAIAARPDLDPLRGDRRFAMLFPAPADFEPPFAERVRIIHEWRGEHAGDEFGWIARGIGDVDGDGVTDVVISATTNPPFGSVTGKLYAYSGRSGRLLWRREGEKGWVLGTSVEAAGDVDHDGIPDVIAGAPGKGVVLIQSGQDGREIHRIQGDSTEANFGGAVAGIGDVDGDGHADFVVGASGANVRAPGAGRAIIFSGRTADRLHVIDGEGANDAFGSAVTGANGIVAIGAPAAGTSHRGRVYILDAATAARRWVEEADSTGVALGAMFLSNPGDVDGDGVADVFASDFPNSAKGRASGRVYVYSGATGRTLLTITGDTPGAALGTSSSRAGDVNGDGHADLAVGAWQFGGAAWSGGRVTIFSGNDGSVLRQITGRVPGETLGFDAVGIGDVDGDGVVDFLITAAYSLVNGARSGRVYVVAGVR